MSASGVWIQLSKIRPGSRHLCPLLFFSTLIFGVWPPATMGSSDLYVCVKGRRGWGERQRESGAGSWVKGGADPSGAQRSWWWYGSLRYWGVGLFWVAAPVLIETSKMTKMGLTGRMNGDAVTEERYSAPHAPLSPLPSRLAPPYFSFVPFLLWH